MVIVLIGPMGCGKTTIGKCLSRRLGWRFEDGDDFHPIANKEKMKAGSPLDDDDRLPWLKILNTLMVESSERGESLIVACSALKKKYRDILGIDQKNIHSVYLMGSPELLGERVACRTHEYMNKSLLASQLDTLEEPATGVTVSIAGSPDEVAQEIIDKLINKEK